MYVLKKHLNIINLEQNKYRDDIDEFEWKYNDGILESFVCSIFGIMNTLSIMLTNNTVCLN